MEAKKYSWMMDAYMKIRRPPDQQRDKVDVGYRLADQSIEIFEIRPVWNDPDEKMKSSVAKATYVKSNDSWKIYWKRADLKWYDYEPCRVVKTLEEFLKLIDEDKYGCFWG